jgi:hypothetical protein
MRHILTVAVLSVLAFLITNKTVMFAQASPKGTVSCAKGADMTRSDALGKGFSKAAAVSQAENFLSGCLVNGEGNVGGLTARN